MEEAAVSIKENPENKDNEGAPDSNKTFNLKFTKRQWILLVLFASLNVVSTITYGLQAPFYPAEAERKGATATEYGFVFGLYEAVIFISSPIFGKYLHKLDPRKVFNYGSLLTAVSVICFGLLDRVNDHVMFTTLSLICRLIEGVGCGAFLTAMFTIIACEFPNSTSTIFASLETFAGLGLIIGPAVGEALFTVGGFSLPFFSVGAIFLLSVIISVFVMPDMKETYANDDGSEQKGYSILKILRIPSVALVSITLVTSTISTGYISALLEPHIRQFGLSPMQTGLMFIIIALIYSIMSPICGYICDKVNKPIYMSILGNFLTFAAFLLIGPASFMPFETSLWITAVGLVIEGFGMACANVSVFSVALKESVNNGLPDNMATNSCVSGLWQSMASLGAWTGPILAGLLYDTVGFRKGSLLVLIASLAIGSLMILYECCAVRKTNSTCSIEEPSETQPLLTSKN